MRATFVIEKFVRGPLHDHFVFFEYGPMDDDEMYVGKRSTDAHVTISF